MVKIKEFTGKIGKAGKRYSGENIEEQNFQQLPFIAVDYS